MTAPLANVPADDRTEQWRSQVLQVLRRTGRADEHTRPGQVDDLLTTTSHDGVRTRPLYTAESELPEVDPPGRFPYLRGGRSVAEAVAGWDVRQRHADPEVAVTRRAVLADLENGVTSLWLVLGDAGLPVEALRDVLHRVRLDLAGLVLDAGDRSAEAADAFFGLRPARASGSLGLDPVGVLARLGRPPRTGLAEAAALAVRCAAEHPGVRAFTVDATVHHDAGAGDAEEIGLAVATGVACLRALTDAGLGTAAAFGQLEFRYAATADQFATIAKFRAARLLWARVAEACGVPEAGAQRQHAVTSSAMMTARDPWSNLLRTTLAGFAAGVSGADAVTVQPFDAVLGRPGPDARRLARNTHALLIEEAGVARVADPGGGSWYLEQLTRSVAEAAWAWFTRIERAGGVVDALTCGLVADRLAATHERRAAAVAHRRQPIVGVSEFPVLDEVCPPRRPAPAVGGGLPVHRYAETFEAARDRADAHATRPTVFLAALGPPAVHAARAAFATNLFAAGGIATVPAGPHDDPSSIAADFAASGLTVACLCSSDKRYVEDAAVVAAALSAAGARRVWLAGRPGPYEGIEDFLYAGCDAVAVLHTTLHDLEVAG
jgi:methylmalonyl-CoA mutase